FLRKNQNQSVEECYRVLELIKRTAETALLGVVAYMSMAFGNPYGDPWDETQILEGLNKLVSLGIGSISLADTVGMASPDLIRRVFESVTGEYAGCDIGVHLHSAPGEAAAKILAAYDAGCRRFDSAIGGLGGCPFAQDALVGNIPTESVITALKRRAVEFEIRKSLSDVLALNSAIAANYA